MARTSPMMDRTSPRLFRTVVRTCITRYIQRQGRNSEACTPLVVRSGCVVHSPNSVLRPLSLVRRTLRLAAATLDVITRDPPPQQRPCT